MGTFAAGDAGYIAKLNALQDAALVFSIKTANFSASNGNLYYINANSVAAQLFASPTAGNRIVFRAPTAGVTGFTLDRNGKNINGAAANYTPAKANFWLEAVYIDASVGWQVRELVPFVDTNPTVCDLRLTLTSGTPVTTADVTAATSVYACPLGGNRIATYDSTVGWSMRSTSEVSVAVPATTNTPFDIFAYWTGSAIALETVNWTNDTTRATALTTQDGVLVKSGDATRRYLGTGRTTGVSGQTEDSLTKRFLWNCYGRRRRPMRRIETTATWTYTTATWRQANASTANQLEFVIGWAEDSVYAQVQVMASNGSTPSCAVGLGLDSTSALATGCVNSLGLAGGAPNLTAWLDTVPAVGRHYIAWIEISNTGGTTTWYGTNGTAANWQAGMTGNLFG